MSWKYLIGLATGAFLFAVIDVSFNIYSSNWATTPRPIIPAGIILSFVGVLAGWTASVTKTQESRIHALELQLANRDQPPQVS